jgi:serine/threonine protein phosphatase PrpC
VCGAGEYYVSNLGDSRAVLGTQTTLGGMSAKPLSNDQTFFRKVTSEPRIGPPPRRRDATFVVILPTTRLHNSPHSSLERVSG